MKVGVLTNLDGCCGIAEYGNDLIRELKRWYDVESSGGFTQQYDVIIANWHPARLNLDVEKVRRWQSTGKKVIIVLHNSWSGMALAPDDILSAADAVVAHEPIVFSGGALKRFEFIKHGIPEVEDLPAVSAEPMIGVAGFPFTWKRFDLVACVAKQMDVKCRIIAPKYGSIDTDKFVDGLVGHLGPLADTSRAWLPKTQVVRMLAECSLNIFWYQNQTDADSLGQSGSVLMGVAAGRPTIISRHRKFRVLLEEYADEFYVAETDSEVYRLAKNVLEKIAKGRPVRVPNRSKKEMGWSVVAAKYHKLIGEIAGDKE